MKRRSFLETSVKTCLAAGLVHSRVGGVAGMGKVSRPLLSAYYFRAQMYTLVPRHVREDMKWMAGIGTDRVCVAILEQDLTAAVENVSIIAEAAAKEGMQLFIVPSRWAGMLAGAPKVPSVFSARNPDSLLCEKDGKPSYNGISGVISSVHYPEVREFFVQSLEKAFSLWPVKGIVWDEPKSFRMDFSEGARRNLGDRIRDFSAHIQSVCDFYSTVNNYIREKQSELSISFFVYANTSDEIVGPASGIANVDYFGCDGRPWPSSAGGSLEGAGKTLPENAARFIRACKDAGKKNLFLLENHNMTAADTGRMDEHLPEFLQNPIDHLLYYYYPRNIENPDENMAVIARHVRRWRKKHG